jgi:polysaccharide export outer membrane protein
MNIINTCNNRSYGLLILTALVAASQWLMSCVQTKQLAYFQGQSTQLDTLTIAGRYVPTIQPGDVLSVQVSSLNPEASSFFNPYMSLAIADRGSMPMAPTIATPLPAQSGYLVDNAGTIELPVLGKVNVAGQTASQVKDRLRESLKEYLKEPTVNIRNLKLPDFGHGRGAAAFPVHNSKRADYAARSAEFSRRRNDLWPPGERPAYP